MLTPTGGLDWGMGLGLSNLIDSTRVISLKIAISGSMDIVELHGDILQPGGQLETPGLVTSRYKYYYQLRMPKNLRNSEQFPR